MECQLNAKPIETEEKVVPGAWGGGGGGNSKRLVKGYTLLAVRWIRSNMVTLSTYLMCNMVPTVDATVLCNWNKLKE